MSKTITYSPAYTLVPTYECFNRCTYCNFRVDPGQSPWLSLTEADATLRSLHQPDSNFDSNSVIEILVLSGEVHPQSTRRTAWIEHLYHHCEQALALGFLPHTNAGPLSFLEMQLLKAVNVSMGLMLEQLTPELLKTVHRHAPSKQPNLRLQQLIQAGELQVPFTTGLLLGIGETERDRWETLEAIAQIHQQYHHIQEVILQPYSPGQQEVWGGLAFSPEELVNLIAIARQILPADVAIQVPPNLIQHPTYLVACLEAGARDLGGISPHDEVNPNYPHLLDGELGSILGVNGWQLVPRLPIYPQYDQWLAEPLKTLVQKWRSRISQNQPLSAKI
ncbi:7,8-didemethyl-8-hydroxy-5-deazariboflavin synthase subunit CofG [Phormidium sp. CLA17]|nr:7,8-didemethyl-8-hydroxy-5-deazariboflavin synthase subunit CofG [Leptolyngbya sp. Cla-17]